MWTIGLYCLEVCMDKKSVWTRRLYGLEVYAYYKSSYKSVNYMSIWTTGLCELQDYVDYSSIVL